MGGQAQAQVWGTNGLAAQDGFGAEGPQQRPHPPGSASGRAKGPRPNDGNPGHRPRQRKRPTR
jgi:hypothetical protein